MRRLAHSTGRIMTNVASIIWQALVGGGAGAGGLELRGRRRRWGG